MKMRWLRDMLELMEAYRDHKEDLDDGWTTTDDDPSTQTSTHTT